MTTTLDLFVLSHVSKMCSLVSGVALSHDRTSIRAATISFRLPVDHARAFIERHASSYQSSHWGVARPIIVPAQ